MITESHDVGSPIARHVGEHPQVAIHPPVARSRAEASEMRSCGSTWRRWATTRCRGLPASAYRR
jgi:hypothetical protein